MVDHEHKEGQGNLHLMLVHYQPTNGSSKVVMPVGLMRKLVSVNCRGGGRPIHHDDVQAAILVREKGLFRRLRSVQQEDILP
jgi:hypothetical protein